MVRGKLTVKLWGLVDGFIVLAAGSVTYIMGIEVTDYVSWFIVAVRTVLIWGVVSIVMNLIFYRNRFKMIYTIIE